MKNAHTTTNIESRLYLDAEVLVLPPEFLPQDAVFVDHRSSSPANSLIFKKHLLVKVVP